MMNASKFTSSGGVTVSAAVTDDGAAVIHVRDTGVGMAASELEHTFDEFAQLDPPAGNPNGGWGLGLTICRRLANFIGASIGVESMPGRGSVFTVRLPPEYAVGTARLRFSATWRSRHRCVRLAWDKSHPSRGRSFERPPMPTRRPK